MHVLEAMPMTWEKLLLLIMLGMFAVMLFAAYLCVRSIKEERSQGKHIKPNVGNT